LRKEEELRKISEEAKELYITSLINNMRNKRFKDTDITELSLIEPTEGIYCFRVRVIVFKATFNNISVILWQSVVLGEETGVLGENLRPVASYR
jgi:hypothetical protein